MIYIDVRRFLDSLEQDWGGFVNAFFQLSPEQQEDYLHTQGYPTFLSLVAHFTAWWERSIGLIEKMCEDPLFEPPPVDVDAFNQVVITNAVESNVEEALAAFEDQRRRMIELVENLSDADLTDARISRQLEIELIGHFEEHSITKPAVD